MKPSLHVTCTPQPQPVTPGPGHRQPHGPISTGGAFGRCGQGGPKPRFPHQLSGHSLPTLSDDAKIRGGNTPENTRGAHRPQEAFLSSPDAVFNHMHLLCRGSEEEGTHT